MHHASCPGAPPPIRPSTHSKATGHSCHSNNKNSTTAYCPPPSAHHQPLHEFQLRSISHSSLFPHHIYQNSHIWQLMLIDGWSPRRPSSITLQCTVLSTSWYFPKNIVAYLPLSPVLLHLPLCRYPAPPSKYISRSLLIKLYWWIFGFGSIDGDDTVPVGGSGDWRTMISSLARQWQRLLLASHTHSHCYSWGWGWSFVD